MMTKFLRFVFATMAIALLAGFNYEAFSDNLPKKDKIDIERALYDQGNGSVNRTLDVVVDAFYDSTFQLLEISCYGLGETSVYVLDSHHHVINSLQFHSEEQPIVCLATPDAKGYYYLVLEAAGFYGEGQFKVE